MLRRGPENYQEKTAKSSYIQLPLKQKPTNWAVEREIKMQIGGKLEVEIHKIKMRKKKKDNTLKKVKPKLRKAQIKLILN